MSITAADMIQDALETTRVYAPGETANSADLARGLGVLNRMMDSWSNESLFCYAILEQNAVLQVGKSVYLIGQPSVGGGPTGQPDWIMQRPLKLIVGPGAAYMLDGNNNRYGVDVFPRDKWNMIGNIQIDSNLPNTIFYDPQFPFGVMNVYPVPNVAWTLYWDSYLQLSRFENLNVALNLPPGYEDAIVLNLAVRLKPYFQTAVLDPDIKEGAGVAKAAVKRNNIRFSEAVFDPEIVSRSYYTYNIYTDRMGSS